MDVALVLLALFLVVLNGFFVASEFAIVKLRETRVEALQHRYGLRGRLLATVHNHLDAYLLACQLGITLASLGLGWIGEPAFARLIEPMFVAMGVTSERAVHAGAFVIAFLIISYLHIVIGELAPKSMAIRRPETMSLWTAAPLYAFYWGMYPFIYVLNASANWILRKAGLDAVQEHEVSYSPDELKRILRSSRAPSTFSRQEWRVLSHAIEFSDMVVRDIMSPVTDLVTLYTENSAEQNLALIAEHRYSRYPVLDTPGGKLLGMLHVKDLVGRPLADSADLRSRLRPALSVDEQMPATTLLAKFRGGSSHLAVVMEGQDITGFVSFDDILAALLGDIQDEFRRRRPKWERSPDGVLAGSASLPVYTLERALGLEITADDSGSVGGLILDKLQRLPEPGERVDFGGFEIVVRSMEGPRIRNIEVIPRAVAD